MVKKEDDILHFHYIIPENFKLNLQRFASAESEGRTEKGSEHKKKKAREEGKVALSKDIPAVLITLFCLITFYFLSGYIFQVLFDTFLYVFENVTELTLDDPKIYYDILIIPCFKIFTPIAIVAVIIGIATNYGQIGFKFTPKAIKPNFKKLIPNVFKFFKEQVFSITSGFNLIKSLVKVVIIVLISYFMISGKLQDIKNLMNNDSLLYPLIFISKMAFDLILQVLLVLLVMAFIDYMFVRWQFEEQMKMKKQEVKEEYKELYGDPNVKGRLKQMYQNILSQKKMLNEVPKADMVITNPTHYAVALKYESAIDNAPRVIAKGEDKFAQMIKEVAKEHNIFMYENVMLARTLYSEVEVNEVIPSNLYSLVINAYKLLFEKRDREKVKS
ncbi:MAG TPA: EscU/YscU/HrcU family type III secretion system export apparatus switch protein [Spirochaetota bacterium]|nr:EscU/YscU/HrcU family type III secretion system export apparatus switch protein [Spirochaetota bacterium]